jgi:arginine/ornithine transport system permease protein
MDFDALFNADTLKLYAGGVGVTLELLAISLAGGLFLSIPLAVARAGVRTPALRWLAWPIAAYTFVIRGTPLLVQVYLIYYGVAQLDWVQARWDAIWPWVWFKEPLFCTLVAFVLNTTAYTIELIAGAIRQTPSGEIEAAESYGMSHATLMTRIVLPSALRRALPAYGNEAILMLHATAIASVVPGIVDITGAANSVYATTYLPFEAYIAAAVIYLALTFMLVAVLRWIEARTLAHLRRPGVALRATALVPAAPDEVHAA